MNIATPSGRTHGVTNVVSRGRFSSLSSGGSGRPSVAPRPPKLFDPTDERRRRKVELERKALLLLPLALFLNLSATLWEKADAKHTPHRLGAKGDREVCNTVKPKSTSEWKHSHTQP